MSFSFVELQIIVGIADDKTLSEIGEDLYLHQPALSRSIRMAQMRAGLQLTERVGRRIRLTSAGEEVAHAARLVLQEVSDIDFLIDRLRRGDKGSLKIIAAFTPANYILPTVMTKFLQKFPDVDVSLRSASSGEMWDLFTAGRYDLAVIPQHVLPTDWPAIHLYDDPLVFFVGPKSPFAGRPVIEFKDLREATLIGPFFQPHWTQLWSHLTAIGLIVERRVDLVVGEGVKTLVGDGHGVGMLYRAAIRADVEEGRLVEINCPQLRESLSYALVRRRTQPLPIVNEFCSMLQKSLAKRSK